MHVDDIIKLTFTAVFSFLLFIIGISMVWGMFQYSYDERLERHIEYLEEYIEDNDLPTPAMRIE